MPPNDCRRRPLSFLPAVALTRVHGRPASFGAFVDKNCSVTLDGQKCLVLPSITYDELLGSVRRG